MFVGDAPGCGMVTTGDYVSAEFFTMVGIPLLAGRLPSWPTTVRNAKVAVVSESLARALAPDGNVIGRRIEARSHPPIRTS